MTIITETVCKTVSTPIYGPVLRIHDRSRAVIRRSWSSPILAEGVYEIRVKRLYEDSASETIADDVYLSDINEIIVDDVAYRNTALVGVKIQLTDQLNGIPKVTYLNHGRTVRVWNGSAFVLLPSSNPAWICLDILTHGRYGGAISDERIDLEKWKEWAAYCDEKNLTFDGVIDTQTNVWDAMQYVLRCGHAQVVNMGTRYTVVVEKADIPVQMFSVANIIKGTFKQTWLPVTERSNEVEVTYYDKDDNYKRNSVKVADPTVHQNGGQIRNAAITLVGVVDKDRAHKEAVFQLNLNRHILQTVEFSAPIEAIAASVGDLVYVQHDMPQWGYGGRTEAGCTDSLITLDRVAPMEPSKSYKLLMFFDAIQRFSGTVASVVGNSITLNGYDGSENIKRLKVGAIDVRVTDVFEASGNYGVVVDDATGLTPGASYALWDTSVIEERDVVNLTSSQESVTTVSVTSPFSVAVPQFANWMFGEVEKVKKPFRVKAISGTHDYRRDITALEYNESVYDLDAIALPTVNFSALDRNVNHVTIQEVTENLVMVGDVIRSEVTVFFSSTQDSYRKSKVFVSRNGSPYEAIESQFDRAVIEADTGDTLIFKVVATDHVGASAPDSTAPTITHVVVGKLAPPSDVTNFTVTKRTTDLVLNWDPVLDLDVAGYEIRLGTSWDNYSSIIVENFAGTMHVHDVTEAGTYYYHIKSIDTGGRYSEGVTTATLVVNRPGAVENFNVVQSSNSLEMRWDSNAEPDIVGYEIREGFSWQGSMLVGNVQANSFSIPAGAENNRRFWIIAIAAPGIYGDTPVFVDKAVAMGPNRNIIVVQDEGALEFPSIKHFLDVTGEDVIMSDGVTRSEYLADVELAATTRARNTLLGDVASISITNTPWSDAGYSWRSLSANRPWVYPGNFNSVTARFQIALDSGLLANESDGWRLNNSLDSVNAIAPSTATGFTYAPGRYGNGVLTTSVSHIDWAVAVPSAFKHSLWLLMAEVTDTTFWRVTDASGRFLILGYDLTNEAFYLEDDLGQRVSVPFSIAIDDRILVTIVQTATMRRLYVGGMGLSTASASESFAAPGTYDLMALY